ncbi:MAG: rod shape-determining protein MreD, partial [Clostridia bacterium]|nr:rod shape-determining protein MreD [Clostridia bacterium]
MKVKLRPILIGILFLFLALTEHCTGPLWWECNPPYLLCAVAICSLFGGEKLASILGLVSGLFADSMTSGVFGVRAVLFLFFGYMVAFLAEKVLSRNVFSATLTGLGCVILGELASWGILCLSQSIPFVTAAQFVFVPRVVMSLPVILLLYVLFSFLYREREPVYPVGR